MGSVGIIPTGDYPFGVIFYRLHEEDVPRAMATDAAMVMAAFLAEPFPGAASFTVRYGIRGDREGTYWIGFNHRACGDLFEQLLRGTKARVTRRSGLPGDNPNPRLRRAIGVDEPGAPEQEPERPRRGRRATAPSPEQSRSMADQYTAAKEELGRVDIRGAYAKLQGLRRGGWRNLGRRRGGDSEES